VEALTTGTDQMFGAAGWFQRRPVAGRRARDQDVVFRDLPSGGDLDTPRPSREIYRGSNDFLCAMTSASAATMPMPNSTANP
jgi:hypothetical protein